MLRLSTMRRTLLLAAMLAVLTPVGVVAQDDPNDAPLGDVARNMRRKTASGDDVIDNDNLTQVMDRSESRHPASSAMRFLMAGGGKGFQVASPDVTCSLSFNANAKALLSSQYAQMGLPPNEVLKLQGPAVIEGDALTVSIFNATEWHVSEVAVALTIVKRAGLQESAPYGMAMGGTTSNGTMKADGQSLALEAQESEVRPERKPDLTVIYRMRAAAAPFATTVFSAPLNLELGPGQEWHWAIVEAKGYPPQSYTGTAAQTAQSQDAAPISIRPAVPALTPPQDSSMSAAPQAPR